jgi:hypothetical protein
MGVALQQRTFNNAFTKTTPVRGIRHRGLARTEAVADGNDLHWSDHIEVDSHRLVGSELNAGELLPQYHDWRKYGDRNEMPSGR